MMVIQLESLNFLKESGYPKNKDCIVDPVELVDMYEDGSVIGCGYTRLDFIDDEDFKDEERKILNKLAELGCEIDRVENVIYFTDEFCVNYGKAYFLALQEKMSTLTPEEYALVKTAEELDELRNLLAFNEVEVASETLNAFLTNFDELTQRRFSSFNDLPRTSVERVPFKIIAIMEGY